MEIIFYIIKPELKIALNNQQYKDLIFDFTNTGQDVLFKKTKTTNTTFIRYFNNANEELNFEVVL